MPKRVMEGKVVSNACDKTVTVLVERRVKDPLYKKVVRKSAKYAAHDENNECQLGDLVTIEECSRFSKRKAWKVIKGATSNAKTTKKKVATKKTTNKKDEKIEDK